MKTKTNIGILIWTSFLTIMVLFLIIIGGLTRLTDSGLSMVDWRPLMGAIPPINLDDWIEVFNNYKKTPEFQIVNLNMTLNEFKFIFWWEWFHRFFARLIGLVFIFPFIYFLLSKKISKNLVYIMMLIFLFGLFQAVIGWWMVKSGLVDNPYVSSYRLAFHLTNALIIFCLLFWVSLSLFFQKEKKVATSRYGIKYFRISLILIFITIISGAFMAGTDAGKSFNTFPLMNEKIFPEGYFIDDYGWQNIFKNTIAINFNHRWLAVFTFLFTFITTTYTLSSNIENKHHFSLILVIITLTLQMFLGIITLIYEAPLIFASLHQTNSVLLLASMLFAYHRLVYK